MSLDNRVQALEDELKELRGVLLTQAEAISMIAQVILRNSETSKDVAG